MSASKSKNFAGSIKRLLIWLVILASWEGAYRAVHWAPYRFPAPSHVLDSMLSMLNVRTAFGDDFHHGWPMPQEEGHTRATLIKACLVSITRLLIGFVFSIVLGGLVGLAMWRFDPFNEFIGPLLLGFQTLPSVCWVPMGIVCFGLSEKVVMFVLIMGSFSAIAIALRDGLRTMPPLYRRAGLMLGATGWKLYRYVLLPASLPAFATSLRQGFSFAWRSLLGAEMLLQAVQFQGLGLLLQNSRDIGGPADVVAVMVVMIVVGMLADRWVFARLQQAINARFGLG